MTVSQELTPSQLSERSGSAISALHFYEREGLIRSRRTSGNQRRYSRDMLRRVAFIRVSQRVGIPLKAVKVALDSLPDDHTPDQEDWARLSHMWKDHLNARILQLEKLRDQLTGCIGCGCLSMKRCQLVNPDDVLGTEGAGPRRILVDGTEMSEDD